MHNTSLQNDPSVVIEFMPSIQLTKKDFYNFNS